MYIQAFFFSLGKLTIAIIVFKIYSATGKILVIYYIKTDHIKTADKMKTLTIILQFIVLRTVDNFKPQCF